MTTAVRVIALWLGVAAHAAAQQPVANAYKPLTEFAKIVRASEASGEPLELEIRSHFNDLTTEQLALLGKCKNLEGLAFLPSATPPSSEPLTTVAALVAALQDNPKLITLRLPLPTPRFSNRVLRDTDLAQLAKLKGLEILDLSRHPLVGSGIADLSVIPNLRVLTLDETAIGSEALGGLTKCKKLTEPSLHGTPLFAVASDQLDGNPAIAVPAFLLRAILGFGTEKLLDDSPLALGHQRVNAPRDFRNLSQKKNAAVWIRYYLARIELRGLDLSYTDITDEQLELLAGNRSLEVLVLDQTKVTDQGLKHLSTTANLQSVSVDFTSVSPAGLAHLAKLPELRTLRIGNAQIKAGLECLSEIKKLRSLAVHHMFFGSGQHLAPLEKCVNLQSLSFSFVDLAEDEMAFMSGLGELRQLHLHYSGRGTGKFLARLPAPEKLQTLSIEGGLSDDGLAALEKMTGLLDLRLASGNISGACLGHLKSLGKLKTLHLIRQGTMQGNPLGAVATKEQMSALANLKELRSLELSGIQADSAGFEHLAKLPELEKVHFHRVEVDDRIVPHLKALTKVYDLELYHHRLSEAGRTELKLAFPRKSRVPGGRSYGFSDGHP